MKKDPTLADVARIAGVSAKTVSRVVNQNDYVSEDTLQRVQEAIRKTGYRPNRAARSLASQHTAVIGVIIPGITNPFYPDVVSGIEHATLERDYNLLIFNTLRDKRREQEAFRFIEENRVQGVIFQCPSLMSVSELEKTLQRQKATVVLGSYPLNVPTGIVRLNIRDAMMQAVEHLVQLGRKNIAFIGTIDDNYAATERMAGLREAANHFGISIPHMGTEHPGITQDVQMGYLTTKQLMTQYPETDGLICFHDLYAYGALDAYDELGIAVPDQVAVVGFDDISYSSLKRISLTTVHPPKFDIGLRAAELLFSMIDGSDGMEEIVLDVDLIVRGSTTKTSPKRPT
jgi:LacI family transcriptional regulator